MKKALLGLQAAVLSLTGAMAFASEGLEGDAMMYGTESAPGVDMQVEGTDGYAVDEQAYFDARGIEFRDSAYIVRCESNGYRYTECRAPGRGFVAGAQIVRQLSVLPCTNGRNWGVTSEGVWVSGGCRAEFRVMVSERRDDRRDDRRGGRDDDRRDDRRGGRGDDRRGDARDGDRGDHRGGRGGRR